MSATSALRAVAAQRCLATLGANLLRRFSSSLLQTKKNLLFQAGFLNLVGERGLRSSATSALRAVAAQRCLATLGANLLRRFSSSLLRAKKNLLFQAGFLNLVGERGFEPPTPSSRTKCATRLRHSPMGAHVTAPDCQRQPLFSGLAAFAWKAACPPKFWCFSVTSRASLCGETGA